ncbi:MAG: hypothetical protein C0501_27345 [Isosphaera sp.]|nr:hypothetical protein [Isosphaera sp.]
MPLFALDPAWNDFYTVGGFFVGLVGFGVTLWQLRKTKYAAEAAAQASRDTLAENKESYERFVGAFASRLLSELQHAVNESDWKIAKVRAHDLAELLGTLPTTGAAALDGATRTAGDNLREFAQTFAESTPPRGVPSLLNC